MKLETKQFWRSNRLSVQNFMQKNKAGPAFDEAKSEWVSFGRIYSHYAFTSDRVTVGKELFGTYLGMLYYKKKRMSAGIFYLLPKTHLIP